MKHIAEKLLLELSVNDVIRLGAMLLKAGCNEYALDDCPSCPHYKDCDNINNYPESWRAE
jgi:hypothetical protein